MTVAAADPKHPAGTVDTVHIEIINRAALGISFKKAAEISGVHSGDLCQLLKGNGVGIIFFYPAENRLHFCVTRKMPADRRLSGHGTVAVKQTENGIQGAESQKAVSLPFGLQRIDELFDLSGKFPLTGGKITPDPGITRVGMIPGTSLPPTGIASAQKQGRVKNHTVIHTALRDPAVNHSAVDQ